MLLIITIFVYFVFLHLLLIFLFAWGNHWKQLYQAVLLDSYALERVRRFFQTLRPVLNYLYRAVDRLQQRKGRPPTDYRFQLRFLLWWKFFEPVPLTTAVRRFNHSPELQQVLQAPSKPYTRFAMYRFLKKLQAQMVSRMCLQILLDLIQQGVLDLSRTIIDSYPVYSFLNPTKCLRIAKFDSKKAKRIFERLDLTNIVELFPKAHGLAAPYEDKLKCWIHQCLWDVPSAKTCHQLVFGKEDRQTVLRLKRGWKTEATYQSFLKSLKQLPNYLQIEQATLQEVQRVLRILNIPHNPQTLTSMNALRGVFHRSLRLKDPGISLATCTSKHQTFMGRGGLIMVTKRYEIPILVQLTTKYKQSEASILEFLKTLQQLFKDSLKDTTILGDAEFGIDTIEVAVNQLLSAQTRFDQYGRKTTQEQLSKNERRERLAVERSIARMNDYFSLEHPRCLGQDAVNTHINLAWLCDLILVKYNQLLGNIAHPHAILEIRG
ncbi:MAG: transposase [Candidatus Hodarchaeota archaeon]